MPYPIDLPVRTMAVAIVALTDIPVRMAALEKWAAQFPPIGVIGENGKPKSTTGPLTFAAGGSATFGGNGAAIVSFLHAEHTIAPGLSGALTD